MIYMHIYGYVIELKLIYSFYIGLKTAATENPCIT